MRLVLDASAAVSDAGYVALVMAVQAPLLTADLRLARAALPGVLVLTIS